MPCSGSVAVPSMAIQSILGSYVVSLTMNSALILDWVLTSTANIFVNILSTIQADDSYSQVATMVRGDINSPRDSSPTPRGAQALPRE